MITIAVFAFLISLSIAYFSQKYFIQKKLIDQINSRSSHNVLATRNGGTSIFLTLFLISIYFYLNSEEVFDFSLIIPLGILYTIGLYDDVYQVDFKLKFIFQIIVAKILVDLGIIIESLNGFMGIYEISYMVSQVLSIFFIVLIINAVNFTDGIDGLAITEIMKALAIIILLSQSSVEFGINFMIFIIMICILPLYLFNFKRNNKVFLGDSGSLFLGGVVSITIINLSNIIDLSYISISTPLLIVTCLMYPIIDLAYVVLRRVAQGKSPFKADNSHIHHFLLNKGFSHLKTLIIISLSTGIIQIISIYLFTN